MPELRVILFVLLAVFLTGASPAAAQYSSPSTELSPYEEQRYGSKLWELPREPYQSEFGQYKARTYIPPEDDQPARPSAVRKRAGTAGRSSIRTESGRRTSSEATVRRRFQSEMKFREDQRKIGERSRIGAPSPPARHRVFGPGQSPALK